MAKAKNPRMVASNSSKELGTSRDTTSSVSAKPKTASARPSIRNTSWPRQEKPSSPPVPLCANLLRSTTSIHHLPTQHPQSPFEPGPMPSTPSSLRAFGRGVLPQAYRPENALFAKEHRPTLSGPLPEDSPGCLYGRHRLGVCPASVVQLRTEQRVELLRSVDVHQEEAVPLAAEEPRFSD